MRYTAAQYDEAIAALTAGRTQLEPDGKECAICGHEDHQAFECGHNPLVAMAACEQVSRQAHELHETLHWMSGFDFHMCVQLGPAKVHVPEGGSGVTPEKGA